MTLPAPATGQAGSRRHRDRLFLASIALLAFLGMLAAVSATGPLPHQGRILAKQLGALVVGGLVFLAASRINYQVYRDQANAVYAACLAVLAAVWLAGAAHRGHRAWLEIGPLAFQPSEFVRLGFILVLARYLEGRAKRADRFSTIMGALGLAAPLLVLILAQPDISTAATFAPIAAAMLYCAGARPFYLAAIFVCAGLAAGLPVVYTAVAARFPAEGAGHPLAAFFLRTAHGGLPLAVLLGSAAFIGFALWRLASWAGLRPSAPAYAAGVAAALFSIGTGVLANKAIKPYQRQRLAAYFVPARGGESSSYHLRQSKIAVGSGGLLGKGLFRGTQSQLGFLPERHTDFIFAVIAEEMGFWGGAGVLMLFMMLVRRILEAARLSYDFYGALVCSGVAAGLGFQAFVNAGMCMGLVPIAGLPLPLVSYGGSSLVATLWSLGIVSNIYERHYRIA